MCGPQSNDAIETPKFLKLVRPSHHLPYGVLGPRARTGNVAPCRVVRRLESPHDSHLCTCIFDTTCGFTSSPVPPEGAGRKGSATGSLFVCATYSLS